MTKTLQKEVEKDRIPERIDLVENYFDQHASYWSNAYQTPQSINDQVLANRNRIAINYVSKHLDPGTTVLDAGCGAGPTTLALLQNGFSVHAVDISQKMLDLCRKNLTRQNIPEERYKLAQADIVEKPLLDASFDGVVALGFLQYQQDENRALATLFKLLKPGGVLVLSGPVKRKISNYFGLANLYYAALRRLKRVEMNEELAILHQISTHYYSVGRFKKLLRQAGFTILEHRGHGFLNFAILHDYTSRGKHFLHHFFTQLSETMPFIGRFGNDMVVVAKKPESR